MEKQVLAVSREPKALSEEENRIEKRTGLRFIIALFEGRALRPDHWYVPANGGPGQGRRQPAQR
jgi:hypothetical protein